MGGGVGPNTDPYANLQDALTARKKRYLETITALDPSKGDAKSRGYLKQSGKNFGPPQRTYSRLEKRLALGRQNDNHSVWTDDEALRSVRGHPLTGEDIHRVIARLMTMAADAAPPYPAAAELPDLNTPALFPTILRVAGILGLCTKQTEALDQLGITYKIWDKIAAAKNHDGNQLFGQSVIDAILDALENGPGQGLADELALPWLAEFTAGGQKIGADGSQRFFGTVSSLIGGMATVLFIETALGDGRTVPNSTPIGPIGNENDDLTLADDVWGVFQFLVWLAGLTEKPLLQALIDMANWVFPAPPIPVMDVHPINPPPLHLQKEGGDSGHGQPEVFHALWANRVTVPSGFQWPIYEQADIYWWRSVVLPICIQHMYALADTSDFHSLAVVRFASIFHIFDPQHKDPRIPDWVIADLKLALQYFKYWLDESGTTSSDGAEMTFWSENHQIQFATSEYMAGVLLPNDSFVYDPTHPKAAADRVARGKARVSDWLDRRLRFGFSEWNAPGYYNEDFPSLYTLVDFAPDLEIAAKAAMVLDTMIFDLARLCCRGSFGVSAGRAYWEHKCYGWEQSIGDSIEVLFGSRGDFVGTEPAAVALSTSRYDVPDVLLAIAIDRRILDRASPEVERVRVSMFPSDAKENGVDPSQGENIVFWWGNMNYFGTDTLDITDQFTSDHPNLKSTPPMNILYKFIHLKDDEWHQVLYDTLETAGGALVAAVGTGVAVEASSLAALLPFPLDLVSLVAVPGRALSLAGIGAALEGIVHLLGDIAALIGKGVHAVLHFFGLADDDPPKIPESAIVAAFHKLLFAFNDGNVLERANLYHYSNGDTSLSSVQMHGPGRMAFQKHPWQATLGTDACVWTTAPLRPEGTGSKARAWLDFFTDFLTLRTVQATEDAALSFIDPGTIFGHDGFTYWNGSMALPMIVQYRSAAIIAYQFNDLEKRLSDSATHAWFPRVMFDEVSDPVDANGGTWVFGRKDNTLDPGTGDLPNSGYVALFSARKLTWTTDGPWAGKELIADGSSNVFICLVGSRTTFGSFDAFKTETTNAYLHVAGVGGLKGIQCSFDVPRENAPAGNAPRLELFYDDIKARFAGQDLDLTSFPRWDNQYASVPWGARSYTFMHPAFGLFVKHDLDHSVRTFNRQPDPKLQQKLPPRRLQDNSLTPVRRFQTPPAVTPVGAQLRKQLFQRSKP